MTTITETGHNGAMTHDNSRTARDTRFWDRIARKYAKGAIADQAGYEKTLVCSREFMEPDNTMLEIGCGTGSTAIAHANYVKHITATDISPEMITIAREKIANDGPLNVDFLVATADELPFTPASFDIVMGHSLFHLVPDLDEALTSARSMLKPGGLLIAKTSCLKEMNPLITRVALPLLQLVGKAPGVLSFSARELQAAMVRNGFQIVTVEYHATKGKKDTRPFIVARRA